MAARGRHRQWLCYTEKLDTDQGESGVLPGVRPVPLGGWHTGQRVRSHLQTNTRHTSCLTFAIPAFLMCFAEKSGGCTFKGFTRESILPSSMSAISCLMPSRASQNRSISALSSDSVGSIMRVPATGHDMVGAWKPGRQQNKIPQIRSFFFSFLFVQTLRTKKKSEWGNRSGHLASRISVILP